MKSDLALPSTNATGRRFQFRWIGVAFTIGFVSLIWFMGGVYNLAAYVNGCPYVAKTTIGEYVKSTADEPGELRADIEIRNLTWHSIRAVGVEASCSCVVAAEDSTAVIAPQSSRRIPFRIVVRDDATSVEQDVVLFVLVDDKTFPTQLSFHHKIKAGSI